MRTIETRYYGPTDYRSSRIRVTDGDRKIFVSTDDHELAMREFCRRFSFMLGAEFVVGYTERGLVFVNANGPRVKGLGAL